MISPHVKPLKLADDLPWCVCAPCRYLGRKKCVQSVCVQPPFLRPQLTEAQLAAKILDNGIQGDLHRVRTAGVDVSKVPLI